MFFACVDLFSCNDTIKTKQGHQICTITGCCVRMQHYSEHEFLDHVSAVRNESFVEKANSIKPGNVLVKANKKNRYKSWVHSKINTRKQAISGPQSVLARRQAQHSLLKNTGTDCDTDARSGSENTIRLYVEVLSDEFFRYECMRHVVQ